MVTMGPIQECLERAVLIIEMHGWTQGPDWCQGSECLGTATLGAMDLMPESRQRVDGYRVDVWADMLLAEVIAGHPIDGTNADHLGVVVGYNDHPERTKDEAVAMMRKAVEMAKERGL